jgi:capsular polysaccharide biosynthesis protein
MFGRSERWTAAALSLEEVEDPTNDGGRPVSLASLKACLRRRRRLWISTAVIGFLLGASFHLILPAKYPAITKLLLVEPSVQAMADDIALLETHTVAQQALADYRSAGGQAPALSPYQGISLSSSIMSVKLSGSSPAEAIAQSNAVATAFLKVRTAILSKQMQNKVNGIQPLIDSINKQIQELTAQIAALPANPHAADLTNQRDGLYSQLTQLNNQKQQAQLTESSLTQGSRVLDPAVYVPPSKKKVIIKDALSGLIAGLALGMMIVVIGDLLSDRVRRRSEVADALGTPVELSVGHLPDPRWFAGTRLRRALRRPSPALRQVEHRLRNDLDSTPISCLTLVEVQAAQPAALALTALAVSLASQGKRVILSDAARGRPLTTIVGPSSSTESGGTVAINGREFTFFVAPEDPAQMAWMDYPDDADVILTLATVDPALGAEHMASSVGEVVVMVRTGATSAVRIDAVGRLLRQALIGVRSGILIDADPNDHSSGLPTAYRMADDPTEHSFGALGAVHP